jgi:hypothetical protein
MVRTRIRREDIAIPARARLVLVGLLGTLLLVGAVGPTPARATTSAESQPREHNAYMVREATVAPSTSNPNRSHRLVTVGLFLVAGSLAAVAAQGMASGRRRTTRRRVEQFHVRRRGPPIHLLVAH